jgi:arylsulfatase A-like enzyme
MRLRVLILLLACPGFAESTAAVEAGLTREAPNVIFILADDLGYSDLGCYGGEIDTPNLDGLAEGGLRFTDFYNSGRCWPSRAALLSGYHAQQIKRDKLPGLESNIRSKRPVWAPLLPHFLKPAGYRSYLSGKFHIDGTAPEGGFDRSFSLDKNSSLSNTPFRRHKTWVHEGGISTPLVVHWPAGIQARNQIRRTSGHFIDIVPTILELAGIEKPAEWQGVPIPEAPGRSIVPAFTGEMEEPHSNLWWLHDGHRALRYKNWKIVSPEGEPWTLYNIKTDRSEQHDLAPGMPTLLKELTERWQTQTQDFIKLVRQSENLPRAN